MVIVGVSIVAMLGIVVRSILLVSGSIKVPPDNAQLAVGVFGLIGAVVGYISGYAGQIARLLLRVKPGLKGQV